jgi:hypothetical protein
MQDQELYKKFKDYFLEALGLLVKESEDGKNIPSDIEEDIKFEGPGSYSIGYVEKKDYVRFIFRKDNLLKDLDTYKACLQYLKDKKYIQDDINAQGFLENTLIDFAKDAGGFQFEENKFEKIYKAIESYISTDLVNFSCSTQLYGFKSDTDEIKIDDTAKIRKYSEEECKQAFKISCFYRSRMFLLSPSDFKLEIIFHKKKEDLRTSTGEDQEELRKTITLLRLFKPSTLRYGPIETKPIQWVPFGGVITSGREEMFGGFYHFNISELPELKKLRSNIKRMDLSNVYPLEIALKRFNFAHERMSLEDKLIDIMIGFETLYSDSNTEIRYKISLRTAILIGENLDQRKIIFRIMQEAYNMRSDLVHGRKLEGKVSVSEPVNKEFTMHEFVDFIKNYLSDSIKAFIVLSAENNHKQILHKLHESSLIAGIDS